MKEIFLSRGSQRSIAIGSKESVSSPTTSQSANRKRGNLSTRTSWVRFSSLGLDSARLCLSLSLELKPTTKYRRQQQWQWQIGANIRSKSIRIIPNQSVVWDSRRVKRNKLSLCLSVSQSADVSRKYSKSNFKKYSSFDSWRKQLIDISDPIRSDLVRASSLALVFCFVVLCWRPFRTISGLKTIPATGPPTNKE